MHILAVDDEELALSSLVSELKIVFPSAKIHGEQNSSNALEKVKEFNKKKEKLRYVFLDINMKEINGIELAKKIKNIYPDVILIFCTAYSDYALDAWEMFAKGYLLKPINSQKIEKVLNEMITDWRKSTTKLSRDIRVQTFGNFEIFVNGRLINFEREKAKELFAYLIDRHGTSVTTREIAFVLWEDLPYDKGVKNRVTSAVTSLRKTLREAHIDDILIKTWNHIAIDISKIKCDAYDYERGDIIAINSFKGEYMSNYSWAEFTTGKYVQMDLKRYK